MSHNNTERGSNDGTAKRGPLVNRRAYLLAAGTTAAVGTGVFSGRASAATTHRGIRFTHTVDMVADAGCDPTGNEACDEQIKNAADDYTLLKFPEGTYKLTEKNVILGATNLGFVGEGDVRFEVPERFNAKLLVVDRGTGLVFENIDIDLRADGATPGLHLAADDDLEVHDVEFIGQGINPDSDPRGEGSGNPTVTNAFSPIVRNPDGTGRITNLVARNAGLMGTYNHGNGRVGVWIGMSHRGTIALENCHIEGFSNNGLYCSRTGGTVQIEGGKFRNNDVSQVRISSRDSYVTNATVEVDFASSDSPNPEDTLNSRGVRFEAGAYGFGGAVARNCDIDIHSTPNSSGAVVVGNDGADHSVLDSRIGVDTDHVRAINAYPPVGFGSRGPPPEPHTLTARGVSVTGTASGIEAIRIDQRPNSVVKDCCINQTGSDRDGVTLIDSDGSVVRDSTIDVTGEPVVEENSRVTTANLSESGSCPAPNTETGSAPDTGEAPDSGEEFDDTLTIEGAPGADYEVAVSGKLEQSAAFDATVDSNDDLAGSHVAGQVGGGGRDSYSFTGKITELLLRGGTNLYFNGERVDPAEYLPNTITIESQSHAEYEITTSDGIVKSQAMGAADPNDTIAGRTATGQVGEGGRDSFAHPGDITDLAIDGEATVYRNGEEVDSGEFGGGNTLTIEGAPGADYELAVNESLEQTTKYDATADSNDDVSGTSASGQVGGGGRDSYTFASEIIHLVLDGGANLYYNGSRTDPSEYLPNTVTIESQSHAEYEITTSDGIVKSTAHGAADPNDHVTGKTATGQVGEGGRDSFAYPGDITDLAIDGEATVYRNGAKIDPGEFGGGNTLTIEGAPGADYELAVTESLEQTTMFDATADSNDDVSGTSASGQVGGGGRDSYSFAGDITRLVLDGGANLYYNGEQIDPSEYLQNTVVIESQSHADYEITTSDGIVKSAERGAADPNDHVTGKTATGQVGEGGRDSFAYPGKITRLDVSGDATVYRNGTVVNDPEQALAKRDGFPRSVGCPRTDHRRGTGG